MIKNAQEHKHTATYFRLQENMKYHNKKTTIDNITFDSKKEADRYCVLKLLQKSGKIKDLIVQPRFILQCAFTDNTGTKHRPIEYRGDFSYKEKGKEVVEDTKGFKTDMYLLKKKLFLYAYQDLEFREL